MITSYDISTETHNPQEKGWTNVTMVTWNLIPYGSVKGHLQQLPRDKSDLTFQRSKRDSVVNWQIELNPSSWEWRYESWWRLLVRIRISTTSGYISCVCGFAWLMLCACTSVECYVTNERRPSLFSRCLCARAGLRGCLALLTLEPTMLSTHPLQDSQGAGNGELRWK